MACEDEKESQNAESDDKAQEDHVEDLRHDGDGVHAQYDDENLDYDGFDRAEHESHENEHHDHEYDGEPEPKDSEQEDLDYDDSL